MGGNQSATWIANIAVLTGLLAGCGSSSTPRSGTATTAPPSGSGTTADSGLSQQASYAHFTADFPASPDKTSIPASIANFHLQIYLAAAKSFSGPVEVAEEDISPDLPIDQVQPALISALRSVAATSGLSITSQPTPTTFRSYQTYSATYSGGTGTLQGVSFMENNSRLYILLAPTNRLNALEASLKLT